MITVDEVTQRFGKTVALDRVSTTFATGKRTGIIGPSAAGKSLLLKTCCGLLPPHSGRITIAERELASLSEIETQAVQQQIGMQFQNNALFDHLNVTDNVAFPLRYRGVARDEITNRVRECLAHVGLIGAEHKRPDQLSGGMRKRVGIARALVSRPRYLLCDDPTAGLDPVTTSKIYELLKTVWHEQQMTIVCVSSDVDVQLAFSDDIVMLDAGRLVFQGSAEQAKQSDCAPLRAFLAGGRDALEDRK